jgi:hypothetical protein
MEALGNEYWLWEGQEDCYYFAAGLQPKPYLAVIRYYLGGPPSPPKGQWGVYKSLPGLDEDRDELVGFVPAGDFRAAEALVREAYRADLERLAKFLDGG